MEGHECVTTHERQNSRRLSDWPRKRAVFQFENSGRPRTGTKSVRRGLTQPRNRHTQINLAASGWLREVPGMLANAFPCEGDGLPFARDMEEVSLHASVATTAYPLVLADSRCSCIRFLSIRRERAFFFTPAGCGKEVGHLRRFGGRIHILHDEKIQLPQRSYARLDESTSGQDWWQ